MRRIATFVAVNLAFLLVNSGLHAQETSAPSAEPSAVQIVVQSQEALKQHDEQKALTLIKEGLVRFPDDESLKIQLARVYVEQKKDRQAIGLLNSILLANPSSRNAKVELAQIFGYRANYREADRLYRELLAADPDDEAASLGLVHNLILEGRKDEARLQLQQAFARHPSSLELQQYSDYLTEIQGTETAARPVHRVQNTEQFFADTSGNRSIYSGQGVVYQLNRNFTGRFRMEETSLWKTGTFTESVLSGSAESRIRLGKYAAVRTSVGAVRFVDTNSRILYGGDLELFPWKHLMVSGGFARYPIVPTFDSTQFNLLSEGWHGRVDYSTRNFSLDGSFSLTHYSDANKGEREWAETLRWFSFHDNKFALGGGYAFRHIHFSKDLSHGYFSPGQYHSHLGAAGFRLRLGKHYRGEYLGYGGVESLENFADYSPAGELLLKNDFYFGKWDLAADYSYYHLIQTTGAFRANAVSVILGYKF